MGPQLHAAQIKATVTGRVKMEKDWGTGAALYILCSYHFSKFREQGLSDRQLVVFMHVRDSYVFHGVDIGLYCDRSPVYMIPVW